MNRKFILAVTLTLAGCLFEPSLSTAQRERGQTVQPKAIRRTALVIGNSNYKQGSLRNPANDARAMGNTLKDLGFDVTLQFNQNLRQMDEVVRGFGQKIKGGGVGLFYFAGHGVQVDGVNYLAPVGARVEKEQDVKFEMLDIGRVTAEMEAAKNGLNILILDACRDNPFTRAFSSPNPGLAPITAPSGTYIAFASAPGTTASDGEGGKGLYTQELLTNLKQPGLRLEDIFIRTRASVKKKSNDKQSPWENGALEGVIVLNIKAAADSTTAAPNIKAAADSTAAAPNIKAAANSTAAAPNKKAAANSTAAAPNIKAAANSTAAAPEGAKQFPKIRYSGIPLSALRYGRFTTASVDEKGEATKREAGPAPYYLEDLGGGVKLEMVYIRGGSFQMGSPPTEPEREEDEIQHPVKVSSFWMGRYEVTQAQWMAVMGRLPECFAANDNLERGDDLPLTCIRWAEAQEFIAKLNELLKLDKERGYSLPREAEWEYAARGGTKTPFPYGETIAPGLDNYNWETVYAKGPTQTRERKYLAKVGSFVANPFGLYDMLGNASEWCEDWLDDYPKVSKG